MESLPLISVPVLPEVRVGQHLRDNDPPGLQRWHMRGTIFGTGGLANSIRQFSKTTHLHIGNSLNYLYTNVAVMRYRW